MGLFKGMKDLKDVTKQAKDLQEQKQAEQGYKKGMAGQMQQMGDMLGQAKEQLSELNEQQSGNSELLTNGIAGQKVGSQVLLVVPADQGYGEQENGAIPANSTLIFDIELIAVQ